MTTLTTLDDLRDLEIGTSVVVTNNNTTAINWTRVADGLSNNETVVPLEFFTSGIDAGMVATGPVYEVGQWWGEPDYGYLYYVYNVTDTIVESFAVYNDGSITGYTWRHGSHPGPLQTQRGTNHTTVAMLSAQMMTQRAAHEAALARATSRGPDLSSMQSSLHDLLENFDEGSDKNTLIAWMEEQGMERPTREVTYNIQVTVDVEMSVNPRSVIGSSAVDSSDVEVMANITVDIEHEDTDSYGGDPCEDYDLINNEWVSERLDEMGISHDSSSIDIQRRRCSHC